jgi:diacylglycerol kinase family enzyme
VTISKGSAYGVRGVPLPHDGVVVTSDHEARVVLEAARRLNQPYPVLGLVGGDLCRTLGGMQDEARLHSADAVTFPVDLAEATVDGRSHLFVAHCIARSPLWRRAVAAMNAQWFRDWNLGPRGHPNDGALDVCDARLSVRDLWQVRRRLGSGTHLPHPRIRSRRAAQFEVTLDHPLSVWVDGEVADRGRELSFRVEPDALIVVV